MRFFPLLLAVCLVAGCMDTAPTSQPSTNVIPLNTRSDVAEYLRFRGYVPEPRDLSSAPVVNAPAQEYLVTGSGYVQVYEFGSETEAADAVGSLDSSLTTEGTVYQHGPLVVAYYGRDEAFRSALTRALGDARR